MSSFKSFLSGGDSRSLGKSDLLVERIHTQENFDTLFSCLSEDNRIVVIRAADAIEKITCTNPGFLQKHKEEIFRYCEATVAIEFQWHLALLLPRLKLNHTELGLAWSILTAWALQTKNSKIVRVHSLQSLFDLLPLEPELLNDFEFTISCMENEDIPSVKARCRILRKKMGNR